MAATLMKWMWIVMLIAMCCAAYAQTGPQSGRYFVITVVDDETGRGVPLVELSTTNNIKLYTDSNGIIAFYEPGLMGLDVHFMVKSHGYEFPKDSFGYAGLTLKVVEGGRAELRLKRINLAERLYRVTGEGIYSDSVLAGIKPPISQPVINGLVMGQDSVLTTLYKGKLWWFWGDTGRPAYPLGNFHTTGASSLLPGAGGLDPEVGVDLNYFLNEGFTKEMARFSKVGPTWLGGLVTLKEANGTEQMYAMYSNVDQSMNTLNSGIAEFDDERQQFKPVRPIDRTGPIMPGGHPYLVSDAGQPFIFFSPGSRVAADRDHLLNPDSYEAFTCAKPGSREKSISIERDSKGHPLFGWKRDTPFLWPADEARLIKEGVLKPSEALFHIQDIGTGKPVSYHSASINWNAYRNRWVMVMSELFGSSTLGEVWYLEADSPLGPWVYARKIVTHDTYSFYNPRHHPMFDQQNGRLIYFEGTYTTSFSGNTNPTPRYEYNQMMYRLDLSNPKLALPVPVYMLSDPKLPSQFATLSGVPAEVQSLPIAFFAPDQPGEGTVPIYQQDGALVTGSKATKQAVPIFYALMADTVKPPPTAVALYEFVRASDGRRIYSTNQRAKKGFKRSEQPFCYVWKNPMGVELPLHRYADGR